MEAFVPRRRPVDQLPPEVPEFIASAKSAARPATQRMRSWPKARRRPCGSLADARSGGAPAARQNGAGSVQIEGPPEVAPNAPLGPTDEESLARIEAEWWGLTVPERVWSSGQGVVVRQDLIRRLWNEPNAGARFVDLAVRAGHRVPHRGDMSNPCQVEYVIGRRIFDFDLPKAV
jgi:hypothetical protein